MKIYKSEEIEGVTIGVYEYIDEVLFETNNDGFNSQIMLPFSEIRKIRDTLTLILGE